MTWLIFFLLFDYFQLARLFFWLADFDFLHFRRLRWPARIFFHFLCFHYFRFLRWLMLLLSLRSFSFDTLCRNIFIAPPPDFSMFADWRWLLIFGYFSPFRRLCRGLISIFSFDYAISDADWFHFSADLFCRLRFSGLDTAFDADFFIFSRLFRDVSIIFADYFIFFFSSLISADVLMMILIFGRHFFRWLLISDVASISLFLLSISLRTVLSLSLSSLFFLRFIFWYAAAEDFPFFISFRLIFFIIISRRCFLLGSGVPFADFHFDVDYFISSLSLAFLRGYIISLLLSIDFFHFPTPAFDDWFRYFR